jgi:DNA replication and repair protein RecF
MDVVISQYDHNYTEALIRYNKALAQRNALLRQEEEPDASLMDLLEEQMADSGTTVFHAREQFVEELTPVFQEIFSTISRDRETVALRYVSHAQRGPLIDVIRRDRSKDRAVGYSLHGIHRDDIEMTIGGYPMKQEGSQGQTKTFVISLKLAQFSFLRRTVSNTTPLLLLDDIFDKLDADRVEQIVNVVAGEEYGQIFMTDTNRENLDKILRRTGPDYKIFEVDGGRLTERKEDD